ncbi:MAG TPA: peptidylprolyl isomerase [Blastocatellia bacterium]|nr:peptidylprolyl isomerase [Blastocatellia bacterium]
MKYLVTTLALALAAAVCVPARAQEPELVNEIVARVNNDIITRADYLAAQRDLREEVTRQMRQQNKSDAEINAEIERLKPTVLDMLIDDLLLQQKAKELGIDVEAEVNQQFLEIAKQNKLPNIQALEKALQEQGIDPEAARANMRKQMQQQYVIQREVVMPIFQRLKEQERREYYDKNQKVFTVPGAVTLSEIFLPLEGYTAAEVEQRARRVVEELRAGMSFAEAVQKNSPATRPSRAQNGKLGTYEIGKGELREEIAKAISTLKPGEVTEPIRVQDGYQIIRLDERKEPTLRKYEEPEVQNYINRVLTMERADEARKKYLKELREAAYIKITPGYGATPAPEKPAAPPEK